MDNPLLLEIKIQITLMECRKLLDELIQNAIAAVKLHFEDKEPELNNAECRWSRDIITVNMIFHNHSG